MAMTPAERQRKYREKQKELQNPFKNKNHLCSPKRLDTKVSSSALMALEQFAAATGQKKEIIVERALIEYMAHYAKQFPAPEEEDGRYFVKYRPLAGESENGVFLDDQKAGKLAPCYRVTK